MLRYVLYLIALVFAVWTVGSSLTQVQSHERAVIRRFGRILEDKPQQGLHIGLPWGIDRVDLVPVGRVRSIEVGLVDKEAKDDEAVPTGQMLTGDHNLVNVQASINFRVRDQDADMERFALNRDAVDAFVARAAESLLAEWVAARKVDEVLRKGKSELPGFVRKHLQERLNPYGLGVEIEQVSIIKLDPPDQVKDAFDKVGQAQTSIGTQVKQAEQRAYKSKSDAKSDVNKIARQAETYASIQHTQAVTEAETFVKRLAQYRELSAADPSYLNALWLYDMTRLYTSMKDAGRIELLDHFLTSEGLTITEFPLQRKK